MEVIECLAQEPAPPAISPATAAPAPAGPTSNKLSALTLKEKIDIIMEEYKTLRAEMIERHTAFIQIFSFGVSGLVGLVTFALTTESQTRRHISWLLTSALVSGVGAGLLTIHFDTGRLANQLQKIEAEINGRANDPLLSWETRHGLWRVGAPEPKPGK
jgi:hypothetical protein